MEKEKVLLILGMIFVELSLALTNIGLKFAAEKSFNLRAILSYSYMFSTVVLIPSAFIYKRRITPNTARPNLSIEVLRLGFVSALFGGTISSILAFVNLELLSGSSLSVTVNRSLQPAIYFVIAVLFKFENIHLHTWNGRLKIAGTCVVICGAMILSSGKGSLVHIWPSSFRLHDHPTDDVLKPYDYKQTNYLTLSFAALRLVVSIVSSASISFSLIFQAKLLKIYPNKMYSTTLIMANQAIQCYLLLLIVDSSANFTLFRFTLMILLMLYGGLINSAVMMMVQTWAIQRKGPLFVSLFSPLSAIIVALLSPIFLDEDIYVCSIIGSFILYCGVFIILWTKKDDNQNNNEGN